MAYTPNQISDKFQADIGRAPTPYELSKFSTSSIQDFANLKNTYSSLKPDQSVVDYLAYQGQDPSMKARSDLAAKYGITGYTGNYQQNVDLLNKLKTGALVMPPKVDGSIIPPTPTITPTTDTTKVDGSISAAATPTPPTINPEVGIAKTAYETSQKAVLDVTGRIDSINKTIDQALQNKRDEIARSGGVVDESQLRSIVLAESAPLLAERKDLLNSRAQLVGEQNIAGKNYNDALNRQKQDEANQFKQQTLDLAKEKAQTQEEQFATKTDIQQTQFEQKIEQSSWKSTKINITDAAGNVLGQKLVWTQNPATTSVDNKSQFTSTSSGNGGIKNGVTNVGNISSVKPPKITLADGGTPEQVLQSLITGPNVPIKGSTQPLTQQTLYNMAIDSMLGVPSVTGSRVPAAGAIAVQDKKTEIMNAYGLTEFDVNAARASMKSISAANLKLMSQAAFVKTYGRTATDNFDLALQQSKLVPRGGAKMKNNFTNWLKGEFTPAGNLAQLETYIYTAAREYAKVTSGGASSAAALTDSAQAEADKLINSAQAPEVFAQVVTAMKADMNNVITNFDKSTNSMPAEVKALFGLASGSVMPKGSMSGTDFVEKSLVRQGLHYDTLIADMRKNIPAGTQPALDNSNGQPVYATLEEIKSGDYTPL